MLTTGKGVEITVTSTGAVLSDMAEALQVTTQRYQVVLVMLPLLVFTSLKPKSVQGPELLADDCH